MSLLLNAYRNEVKGRDDIKESRTNVAFQSGFDLVDYRNGKIVYSGENDENSYYSVGFDEGKYVLVVGPSGCGKTTWVIQSAARIVAPFENGAVYHDDIENATTDSRIRSLTGWTKEDIKTKYFRRDAGINAENFYENVKVIHDLKIKLKDKLLIDSGVLDSEGEPIMILPPTVYILDSLALLMPKSSTEENELSGQMSATAAAKTNAAVFKRLIPLLNRANIILMVINHINEKVEINPMMKSKSKFNYLKQNETIPGKNYCLA